MTGTTYATTWAAMAPSRWRKQPYGEGLNGRGSVSHGAPC